MPLPELIATIVGVPPDIAAAAGRLACSTCAIVNVGLDRADISDWHWTYFYDDDFCFSRVSFPHMLSPHNAPPGAGSIQAELYFSKKYKPLDRRPEELIEPTIRDLRRCGLVRDSDRIVFSNVVVAKYANVIFDLERAEALALVHGYLDDLGIRYCGRYGEWGYHWTDEAYLSGEKAAERVLEHAAVGR
jgi:protoporphyrinogen oxidase